jgi:hypothetical protein
MEKFHDGVAGMSPPATPVQAEAVEAGVLRAEADNRKTWGRGSM